MKSLVVNACVAVVSLILVVGCSNKATTPEGSVVQNAPTAASWAATFSEGLEDAQGKAVPLKQLNGKIVGIYFSAHWCPPCRAFSPKLVAFRNQNKEQFEVVFVSSDSSADAKKKYMEELKMLWPSVPFGSASGRKLATEYEVQGIPTLLIFGPDGQLLTADGRGDVASAPDQALAQWQKQAASR